LVSLDYGTNFKQQHLGPSPYNGVGLAMEGLRSLECCTIETQVVVYNSFGC